MPKFNPQEHLKNLAPAGKPPRYYLETKWRLVWFREDYPQGTVTTEAHVLGDMVYVRARVLTDTGIELATGLAGWRVAKSGDTWAGRELEKCETAAIGRALGHAGYGTQFTNDDDVADNNLADAPVEHKAASTNGQKTDAERPANGNGNPWHKSADNVQLIATRLADEFNLELNPTDVLDTYLDNKPLQDFPTGKEAFEYMRNNAFAECLRAFVAPKTVTTASGEPVDPATGEILDAPPSVPENANSDAKNDAPSAEDDKPTPKAFSFPSWFEPVRNTIVEWPHFAGKKWTTPSARRIHASNAINELLKDGTLTMDMTGQNALDILSAKYQPEGKPA